MVSTIVATRMEALRAAVVIKLLYPTAFDLQRPLLIVRAH